MNVTDPNESSAAMQHARIKSAKVSIHAEAPANIGREVIAACLASEHGQISGAELEIVDEVRAGLGLPPADQCAEGRNVLRDPFESAIVDALCDFLSDAEGAPHA